MYPDPEDVSVVPTVTSYPKYPQRHQGPHSSSLGSDAYHILTVVMPFLLVDQMQYAQVKMQSP